MNNSWSLQPLSANWVSIVCAVALLIAGWVLTELGQRLKLVYENFRWSAEYVNVIVHVLLCLMMMARFIQTYVTAAIDYNPWTPGAFDVLLIIVVGVLLYSVSLTVGVPDPDAEGVPKFDVASFHRRLSALGFLTIVGYVGVLLRLHGALQSRQSDYPREVELQAANILGILVGLMASFVIVSNPPTTGGGVRGARLQMLLAGVACVALALNIHHSLSTTFRRGRAPLRFVEPAATRSNHNVRLGTRPGGRAPRPRKEVARARVGVSAAQL